MRYRNFNFRINKKILIPVASALLAIVIVFTVVAFTGKPDASKNNPSETEAVTESPTLPVSATTAPNNGNTLKMSFIGDCVMGGDPVNYGYESFIWFSENNPPTYFFEKVKPVLEKDDFTLANMETVLSDNLSLKPVDKGDERAFWFMAKTKNADILTEGSVEVAGVVNNHTYDFGDEGYNDTVKALEDRGLLVGEDCSPLYFEKNGIKVGVVYANLWGYYQTSYIMDALEEMQDKCDYKVVFFHGGEEGRHEPDNFKIDACRDLANSGLCDLIVGAHPHVLQPLEVVNDVPILYSLGNFCFAGNNYPENMTVIFGVNLTRTNDGTIKAETEITPCYVYTGEYNTFQPAIMTDAEDMKAVFDLLSTPVDYTKETQPATTTAPKTEPEAEEEYYPEEEYSPEEDYYPEEDEYIEPDTEEYYPGGEEYYPEETEYTEEETYTEGYFPEEDDYYTEEIETAISYY
ncbi:MAG: CapA family protein [Clostridia bacterium]|nr:CapA family protein [Clostridia bacterium]